MNIAESVHRAAPESIAVSGVEGTHTYGQLADSAARLSAILRQMGLTGGDRVGVVLPNTTVHILTYLAATAAGHVVVSVNPKSTASEIARAFERTGPKVVVATTAALPAVRAALSRLAAPVELVGDEPTDGIRSVPELLAASPARDAVVSVPADHPATILFTSGSTGLPKGVVLTHGNVVWAARAKASRMRPTTADTVALIAPLHHAYGQNAVLNVAFSGGAAVVLLAPHRRKHLVADLARYGATVLPTVPAVFQVLLDLGADRHRLPLLRYALSAAAPLPRRVAEEWLRRFGFPIHEGYGLTETSPCALYNDQSAVAGSLGTPFDGVRTRVVDDAGAPVPIGQVGELLISGPNVMRGYFGDPVATSAAVVDGWLRTGDHVRRDERGELWLAGRKKNLIIVSGANVFPTEVEAVLRGHTDVVDAVVVGRPHPVVGETVLAFVRLRDRAEPAAVRAELRDLCRAELTAYKRPSSIRFLDSVPLLASGKPDLERLRGLARDVPSDQV